MQVAVVRHILDFPKDANGLFLPPTLKQYQDPDFQTLEQHNRDRAAAKSDYADQTSGNPHTVDPTGKYICIGCNQRDGFNCLLMNMSLLPGHRLNLRQGSCGKWEIICAGDKEVRLHHWSPVRLGYAESLADRFGCAVCPLKVRALMPDSLGRTWFCLFHYMRVFPNSCCNDNATKVRRIKYSEAAYAA